MKESDINGIIIRIEEQIHFFWLDEDHKLIDPSIAIGDSEDKAYADMDDDYIRFVHMKVEHKEGHPMKLKTYDDYDNFKFISSMREGMQIRKDDKKTTILEVMKDDALPGIIDSFFEEEFE